MTLQEMADFVCGKVRQTDTIAIAECKKFLQRRYELVYNEALWRDSIHVFDFEAGPDCAAMGPPNFGEMQEAGLVWFPSVVGRLVALRSEVGALNPEDEGNLYRVTEDQYEAMGEPVVYTPLAPVVAAGLVSPIAVYAYCVDDGDAINELSGSIIDGTGARLTFRQLNADGIFPSGDAGSPTLISANCSVVERVTKMATSDNIKLVNVDSTVTYAIGLASSTSFERRFGARILPRPKVLRTFHGLVKKKPLALVDDDEPELRDVTNALVAFAQGDMLERGRQYGKAATKFGEGLELVAQLKRIAVWQEANSQQVLPEVAEQSGQAGSVWNPWGW